MLLLLHLSHGLKITRPILASISKEKTPYSFSIASLS